MLTRTDAESWIVIHPTYLFFLLSKSGLITLFCCFSPKINLLLGSEWIRFASPFTHPIMFLLSAGSGDLNSCQAGSIFRSCSWSLRLRWTLHGWLCVTRPGSDACCSEFVAQENRGHSVWLQRSADSRDFVFHNMPTLLLVFTGTHRDVLVQELFQL